MPLVGQEDSGRRKWYVLPMAKAVRRRELLGLVGGAAVWPLTSSAQQRGPQIVGYLSARSPDDTGHLIEAFKRGLAENGYIEGKTIDIEYRFALGSYDRLPSLARELADRSLAVLVSVGGEPAALAAKEATATTPIVFAIGSDPVKIGLVASYARPGGNLTGINILSTSLEPKRLGLLRELVPQAATIGILLNQSYPPAEMQLKDVQAAAQAIGLRIHAVSTSTDREIEAAFETVTQQRIPALMVGAAPFFDTRRDKLVELAARHAVPTIYQFRAYVAAGGLASYGVDLPDAHRQVGVYASQILKGAKPADLPVLQPTKFEFVVNLKTAKALGLVVPAPILLHADEVIE